jgi:hypothetical protein
VVAAWLTWVMYVRPPVTAAAMPESTMAAEPARM